MKKEFSIIWNCVRDNGDLIKTAKTSWGADKYALGDVVISLEDDGYTKGIFAKDLQVREIGKEIVFAEGNEYDLDEIYQAFCLLWGV